MAQSTRELGTMPPSGGLPPEAGPGFGGGAKPRVVLKRDEEDFIRDLVNAVSAGYRLVPFIGSGCSAHSGILMGNQFSSYLAWTVYACVADRRPTPRWNLRKQGWPPTPSPDQLTDARQWVTSEFSELAGKHGMFIDFDGLLKSKDDGKKSPTKSHEDLLHLLNVPIMPPVLRGSKAEACPLTNGEIQRELLAVLTDSGLSVGGLMRRGISSTSEDAIVERAIRALYDWRATLQFLSELKLAPDGHTLLLDKPDQTVVDGFNVHITRGRRPSLTHAMLCHLRQPARMRLILTTNFDTLIEDAFAEQERRIDVISVGTKGSLPDPEIVHSRDTVVKIHGTVIDTRADFSLDEVPSIDDRKRFFHYVRGGNPDSPADRFLPGHLLVAGYSGNDARCVQLMKAVLDDPDARIFWVCHSDSDLRRLELLFQERAYRERIVVTVHERVDLLLYEFHQQLCLHLPPGSLSEHINHNVPAKAVMATASATAADGSREKAPRSGRYPRGFGERVVNLEDFERAVATSSSLVVVDGMFGILGTMREVVASVARTSGLTELWFELEDYGGVESLAHDLFQQIASRQGVFHSSHELCPRSLFEPAAQPGPVDELAEWRARWRDHLELIKSHVGIAPEKWIVVLYGRNGPGGCCGWSETEFWDTEQYRKFEVFLLALKAAGFRVVYAPYSETRSKRDQAHRKKIVNALVKACRRRGAKRVRQSIERVVSEHFRFSPIWHQFSYLDVEPGSHWPIVLQPLNRKVNPNGEFGATVNELIVILTQGLVGKDGSRSSPRRLLYLVYGASLFRQSRHYTSFLGEGVMRSANDSNFVGFDNDLERHRELQDYLKALYANPPVFLRKPGGFVWAYRNVRLALRCLVDALSSFKPGALASEPALLPARRLRARAHFDIGVWYRRAFYVSGHANPLMEAAYHFWQCMQHAGEAHGGDPSKAADPRYRLRWWQTGLRELVKALRSAEAPLRYWCGRGELERWFGTVESKSVSEWLPEKARQLATDLTRGIPGGLSRSDSRLLQVLSVELHQLGNRLRDQQRTYAALSLGGLTVPPAQVDAGRFRSPLVFGPEPPTDHIELWERWARWWKSPAPQVGAVLPKWLRGLLRRAFLESKRKGVARAPVVISPQELRTLIDDPSAAIEAFQQLVIWTFLLGSRAKRLEHAAPFEEAVRVFKGPRARAKRGEARPHRIKPVPFLLRRVCTPYEARRKWLMTCLLASATVQAAHWLLPGHEEFVSQQLSKTYAMYGLALARLHRFYEAHGKFNQAQALLAESRRDHLVNLGLIDLRRAEAYLLEALLASEVVTALATANRDAVANLVKDDLEKLKDVLWPSLKSYLEAEEQPRKDAVWLWLKPQLEAVLASCQPSALSNQTAYQVLLEGLWRIVVARGDDAWGCLERAENLLSGRTHSSLWWSRLRALQLHVLAVDDSPILPSIRGHRALSERVLHDRGLFASRLWNDGRVAAPQNRYNRLRLLDYYARAIYVTLVLERRSLTDAERSAIFAELGWLRMEGTGKKVRTPVPGKSTYELERNYQVNVAWRVQRVLDYYPGQEPERLNYPGRRRWRKTMGSLPGVQR
jgi:hypothetical protein